jgi:hypothetical protein
MIGELYVNMIEEDHPIMGSSPFLLKRWRRFSIFAKSGSYFRTENPSDNLYQSCSTYLYDYVVVSKDYYSSLVYTASFVDDTPSVNSDWVEEEQGWQHREGTFRNSPNAVTNNYMLTYNALASIGEGHPIYGSPYVYIDDGTYFEVVKGYPRNHLSHKRSFFSLFRIRALVERSGQTLQEMSVRNRQTNATTVGLDGLEDGSEPVQTTQVGNVTLYRTDSVINE